MLKLVEIISNKLLYFSEIGEKYTLNLEEMEELIKLLNKARTDRRFKVSYAENNEYAVIWRAK